MSATWWGFVELAGSGRTVSGWIDDAVGDVVGAAPGDDLAGALTAALARRERPERLVAPDPAALSARFPDLVIEHSLEVPDGYEDAIDNLLQPNGQEPWGLFLEPAEVAEVEAEAPGLLELPWARAGLGEVFRVTLPAVGLTDACVHVSGRRDGASLGIYETFSAYAGDPPDPDAPAAPGPAAERVHLSLYASGGARNALEIDLSAVDGGTDVWPNAAAAQRARAVLAALRSLPASGELHTPEVQVRRGLAAFPEASPGWAADASTVGVNRKLGRNDTCWCGSGRKYKACHLDADGRPVLVDFWDLQAEWWDRVAWFAAVEPTLGEQLWDHPAYGLLPDDVAHEAFSLADGRLAAAFRARFALSPTLDEWLTAHERARLGLFHVSRTGPDRLECAELLSEQRCTLLGTDGAELERDDVILARVVPFRGGLYLVSHSAPYDADAADVVLAELDDRSLLPPGLGVACADIERVAWVADAWAAMVDDDLAYDEPDDAAPGDDDASAADDAPPGEHGPGIATPTAASDDRPSAAWRAARPERQRGPR